MQNHVEVKFVCNHTYSKTFYQSFPRKCIHCGEPERHEPVSNPQESWEEILATYIKQDIAIRMTLTDWLRANYNPPTKLVK